MERAFNQARKYIRDALELSRSLGLAGSRIEWLFEMAAKTARRVHGRTGLGHGKVSLAEIAIAHARARLAEAPSKVALVGVSPMTIRCAEKLARHPERRGGELRPAAGAAVQGVGGREDRSAPHRRGRVARTGT